MEEKTIHQRFDWVLKLEMVLALVLVLAQEMESELVTELLKYKSLLLQAVQETVQVKLMVKEQQMVG